MTDKQEDDGQQGVRVERRGRVLEITLDRPKVNAIDTPTSRALGQAFARLRDDPELLPPGERTVARGGTGGRDEEGRQDDAGTELAVDPAGRARHPSLTSSRAVRRV